MVGVLRMGGDFWRCCLEGYAELQVTVYWCHGGMRGGTGVFMGEYQGRAAFWGAVQWGRCGVAWRYWAVPLNPSNNSGGMQGHPLAP